MQPPAVGTLNGAKTLTRHRNLRMVRLEIYKGLER